MVDSFQIDSGLASTAPRPVRKKFAKPPVKVACLPCRNSRTRCGGQEPCANCVAKGRKCSYLPSKRGGPRKKKLKLSPSPEEDQQPSDDQHPVLSGSDFEERIQYSDATVNGSGTDGSTAQEMFHQIDMLSAPGAGLRHLDFSQLPSLFQGYYTDDGSSPHIQMDPMPSPLSNTTPCLVRTYGSEAEILNAYYDFIHCYFPILPPRASPPCPDRPLHCPGTCPSPSSEPLMIYRPLSPLSLAISAVLALIPHPNDPEPSSPASILQRRTYAHAFAQLANSIIEAECDLEMSSTDPGQALSTPRPSVNREKLHPHTPQGLETLLALLILSVYEYSQRGNLLKMRYRASQALALALDMSLHSHMGDDEFSEARRRAWWMTYYCVMQASIVGTTPPTLIMNDPQFTTAYPRFDADAEGWSILIQAQQVLVSATSFIAAMNKAFESQSNMHYIFEQMQQLDSWTNSVLAQMDMLPIVSQAPDFGDYRETVTSQSIRAISRIKLSSAQIKIHRFRAFSDIPIFIKRHCDLTAAKNTTPGDGINNVSCSCGNLDAFQRAPSTEYLTPSDSSSPSDINRYAPQYHQNPFASSFPYTAQHSAKVCLRAALVISRMFESLPVPAPLPDSPQQVGQHGRQLPRTMPSFACCLMQSSYAMFMLFYKARVAKQISSGLENPLTAGPNDRLIDELSQGLQRIIAAVSNYALAFEALDGMRDDIQGAYQTAFPSATI